MITKYAFAVHILVLVRWPIAAATLQLNLMSDVHVEFDNLAQTESTNTFVG